LQEAAAAKLKEIHSAFDYLTATAEQRATWHPPSKPAGSPTSSPQGPDSTPYSAASDIPNDGPSTAELIESLDKLAYAGRRKLVKLSFAAVAFLVLLLLSRYLWIAFDLPGLAGDEIAQAQGKGKKVNTPQARFLAAIESDWKRLSPSGSEPAKQPTAQPSPAAQTAEQKPTGQHSGRGTSAIAEIKPYLTVGSTVPEVIDFQGTPTSSTADKIVYGKSELYIKNGAVVGWRIDPASPIRVKLWPSTAVDPTLASYTVGSTKDVVLTVQGTPTAFADDKFEYGKSVVFFRRDKVVSWKEDPNSTPLWAR